MNIFSLNHDLENVRENVLGPWAKLSVIMSTNIHQSDASWNIPHFDFLAWQWTIIQNEPKQLQNKRNNSRALHFGVIKNEFVC